MGPVTLAPDAPAQRRIMGEEATTAFNGWLAEMMDRNGVSASTLALRLHVGESTVRRWLKGSNIPDPASCNKIAEFFSRRPAEVLMRAGHLPMDGERLADLEFQARLDAAERKLAEGVAELASLRREIEARNRARRRVP